ncbi:MAG: hypothetical protein KF850_34085 [Labilithrix sp.]|nr:hypothetical protein [Labilithrix sp.]
MLALALVLAASAWSSGVRAADDDAAPTVPKDFPRLVFDTGRPDVPAPDPDAYRFTVHGEHQIRYQVQRSFPLTATASAIDRRPGLAEQSLGQNQFLSHWLRVTPRLQMLDTLELVGQLDLVTGLIAGDRARDTRADMTPRDEYNGFSNVQPRWLYAQWRLPFGVVRVGQQPNHWGMGILANDGDHPTLFGDYRYGSISERILFATKPGGEDSDFYLAVAGDLVFRDQTARLTRGERAFQGVLAAFYEKGQNKLGIFSTLRHQENDKTSGSPIFGYTDELDAVAIVSTGGSWRRSGDADAFVFGEASASSSTSFIRTADQAARERGRTQVRFLRRRGGIGVVHRAQPIATGFWRSDAARLARAG